MLVPSEATILKWIKVAAQEIARAVCDEQERRAGSMRDEVAQNASSD